LVGKEKSCGQAVLNGRSCRGYSLNTSCGSECVKAQREGGGKLKGWNKPARGLRKYKEI